MIKIICKAKQIEIIGHANANKAGQDIVCAAVSCLVITCVNSLEGFSKKEISSEDGHVLIKINHKLSYEDKIRLDMMRDGLTLIAKKYKKYVQIKKEK